MLQLVGAFSYIVHRNIPFSLLSHEHCLYGLKSTTKMLIVLFSFFFFLGGGVDCLFCCCCWSVGLMMGLGGGCIIENLQISYL